MFLAFGGKQSRPTFVFDRTFLWVETESVEPTIDGRSYVMVKRYKGEKIGVGDIIVFECPDESSPIYGSLIIHRVIDVTDEGYRTKGDNEKSLADTWTFRSRRQSPPRLCQLLCAHKKGVRHKGRLRDA